MMHLLKLYASVCLNPVSASYIQIYVDGIIEQIFIKFFVIFLFINRNLTSFTKMHNILLRV